MSAEITPAIERVTDVLIEHREIVCVTGDPDVVAYDILDHALSVDEMAAAIIARYPSFEPLSAKGIATAVRAALLGATP